MGKEFVSRTRHLKRPTEQAHYDRIPRRMLALSEPAQRTGDVVSNIDSVIAEATALTSNNGSSIERNGKSQEGQTYLKTKRERGVRAFHLEYDTPPTRTEIGRELRSYLAEYRLAIPEYSYELLFGRGVEGDQRLRLRNIDHGEPLGNKTKRVIEERELWFEPTEREKAEDRAIETLDAKLRTIKTGDTVIWASPPGPKEQGYGDYGFLFVGRAKELENGEAHLAMTAIRIENPKPIDEVRKEGETPSDPWVTQVNSTLSTLTETPVAFQTREDALGQPFVVGKTLSQEDIHRSIKDHFNFAFDTDAQAKSEAIIAQMDPLISEATLIMQVGTKKQKQETLWALENYALKLKADASTVREGERIIYMRIGKQPGIGALVDKYGKVKPPKVRGSCGISEDLNSKAGDTLSGATGAKDQYGSRRFTCPDCGETNFRAEGVLLSQCQHCESKSVAC